MFEAKGKIAQMTLTAHQIHSGSADDTRRVGRQLAGQLKRGDVVLLRGAIGAGKSVLVQGMLEELGDESWLGSPTFALVYEYDTDPEAIHMDLYRLGRQDVVELDVDPYLDGGSIVFVEWADRAEDYLTAIAPREPIWIDVAHAGGNRRLITVHGPSRSVPQFREAE